MQIKKRPYKIDFAGNCPEFVLRATPWYKKGRRKSATYRVDSLPVGTLYFGSLHFGDIPGTVPLKWEVKTNPGDGLYELQSVSSGAAAILDALEAKFIYNPSLRQWFDISAWVEDGSCWMKITSLEETPMTIDFYHEGDEEAIVWTDGVTGASMTPKHDYRVLCFFSGDASGKHFRTPDFIFEESDGDVRVDCAMLQAYFQKPDIPAWGEFFIAKPCSAATMQIRLYFGEMYDDSDESAPVLKTLERSASVTLVNGLVSQYAADNNIPDWTACNDDHLHLKAGMDIFGQDNGETVIVPRGVEQYLYLYNYSSVNMTVRIQESATFADGTSDDDWQDENLILTPGVNRITVREDEAVAWKVTITDSLYNRVITRNYVVREFEYGFHTFLLLDKLNLYESFPVEYLSREEQTEGERRIIAGVDSYDTTDRQTVHTAKCTARCASGLKLMRSAFEKQDNLLLDEQYAWYIDMIPGSMTLENGEEDVLECEFKFRLREKVSRNPQVIATTDELEVGSQIMKQDTVFK